jgi:hypothetical protein
VPLRRRPEAAAGWWHYYDLAQRCRLEAALAQAEAELNANFDADRVRRLLALRQALTGGE